MDIQFRNCMSSIFTLKIKKTYNTPKKHIFTICVNIHFNTSLSHEIVLVRIHPGFTSCVYCLSGYFCNWLYLIRTSGLYSVRYWWWSGNILPPINCHRENFCREGKPKTPWLSTKRVANYLSIYRYFF